jgi:hypothetical protein
MNKELKFNELKELAKANNIPTPFGIKKEELKNILTERGYLKENPAVKIDLPQIKEKSKKEEMIEIPEELKHLGLIPTKIKTLDEVNINNRLNTEKKLVLPQSVMEQLEREGYKVRFPTEPNIQRIMNRGGQFVKRQDGSVYKIDSGGCDEKGERIYHIAMKIKKEILDKEDDLFRAKQSSKKKQVEEGANLGESAKAGLLKVPKKYVKLTNNTNNNL